MISSYKMASYPTDCLVLKIDEFDPPSTQSDMTLYVIYDVNNETFVVRGKRSNEWQTHNFYCDSVKGLVDFISTVICERNLWSYTLYNYDNLLECSDDITFGYLEGLANREREISGYDDMTYDEKFLKKMLKVLRNVYNYY